MSKENGGPAFPNEGGHKFTSGNEVRKTIPHPGMTIRDYFAAKAVSGLLAGMLADGSVFDGKVAAENMAEAAGQIADAMIAERAK